MSSCTPMTEPALRQSKRSSQRKQIQRPLRLKTVRLGCLRGLIHRSKQPSTCEPRMVVRTILPMCLFAPTAAKISLNGMTPHFVPAVDSISRKLTKFLADSRKFTVFPGWHIHKLDLVVIARGDFMCFKLTIIGEWLLSAHNAVGRKSTVTAAHSSLPGKIKDALAAAGRRNTANVLRNQLLIHPLALTVVSQRATVSVELSRLRTPNCTHRIPVPQNCLNQSQATDEKNQPLISVQNAARIWDPTWNLRIVRIVAKRFVRSHPVRRTAPTLS